MALILISDLGRRVEGDPSFRAPGVAWDWDGARLTITNTAHGFVPLYIARASGSFGVATDIASLLPYVGSEFDRTAIALFLRMSQYYGEDTPFAQIKAFPAAGILRWEAGEETWDDLFEQPAQTSLDRKAIKQRFNDLFVQALERWRPERPTVMPLSGGRDSRHILLELHRQGRLPDKAVTARYYQPIGNVDTQIAAQLAKRVGIPWRGLSYPRPYFGAFIETLQLTSFQTLLHAWLLPVAQSISGQAAYDGIGGDILSAGARLNAESVALYETGQLEALADRMLAHSPGGDLPEPWRSEFPASLARERLLKELACFAHLHNPMTQFLFWNRTRRSISQYTYKMLGLRNDICAPYLDRDLCRFLLSVSTAQTIGQTLHSEVIGEQFPDFSDIPYSRAELGRGGRLAALKFVLQSDRYTGRGTTPPIEAVRAMRRRGHDRQRQMAIYLQELRKLTRQSGQKDPA